MFTCLYKCKSSAPSTQKYHIYPASASTLGLTLRTGVVCDKCNSYFSKLEKYFVERHPGTATRLLAVRKTRKGKAPILLTKSGVASRVDKAGLVTETSYPLEDLRIIFKPDGNIAILGETTPLPFDTTCISRVLAKIALETLIGFTPDLNPFSGQFDSLREYARFGRGSPKFLWFGYRLVQAAQSVPHLVTVSDKDGHCLGKLILISFPGIHYLLPLPPVVGPDLLKNPDGWTFVTAPGTIEQKKIETKVELVKVKDNEFD